MLTLDWHLSSNEKILKKHALHFGVFWRREREGTYLLFCYWFLGAYQVPLTLINNVSFTFLVQYRFLQSSPAFCYFIYTATTLRFASVSKGSLAPQPTFLIPTPHQLSNSPETATGEKKVVCFQSEFGIQKNSDSIAALLCKFADNV